MVDQGGHDGDSAIRDKMSALIRVSSNRALTLDRDSREDPPGSYAALTQS